MQTRPPVGRQAMAATATREERHVATSPSAPAEPPSEARNSTVDRALRVLEAFLGEEGQIGVLELSRTGKIALARK